MKPIPNRIQFALKGWLRSKLCVKIDSFGYKTAIILLFISQNFPIVCYLLLYLLSKNGFANNWLDKSLQCFSVGSVRQFGWLIGESRPTRVWESLTVAVEPNSNTEGVHRNCYLCLQHRCVRPEPTCVSESAFSRIEYHGISMPEMFSAV